METINSPQYENEQSVSEVFAKKSKKKTIVIVAIVATVVVIIASLSIIFYSMNCNSSNPTDTEVTKTQDTLGQAETVFREVTFPNITSRGVEPFVKGALLSDIPPKGDYYDTVIWKLYYVEDWGEGGCDYFEVETLNETPPQSEFAGLDVICKGIVKLGKDTLFEVETYEDFKIHSLDILSDKLRFENGLHIGTPADTIYSVYGGKVYAVLGEGNSFSHLEIRIPHMSGIWIKGNDGTMVDYYSKECERNSDPTYGGYCIPLKYAAGITVSSISIRL